MTLSPKIFTYTTGTLSPFPESTARHPRIQHHVLRCIVTSIDITSFSDYRVKRVSDQRLAELETLLVLAKINREMQMNMPLGYGTADPYKL